MNTEAFYLLVPLCVDFICGNTSLAIVRGANGMHGLMVASAGDGMGAIAGVFSFRVVHLCWTCVARVL